MSAPRVSKPIALILILAGVASGLGACGGGGSTSGSGGSTASGGSTGTGGKSASGGSSSSGGASATGGVTATGGASATGGATSTGGVSATGGATSGSGGAATGGSGSGGANGTGGSTGTGGAATGGAGMAGHGPGGNGNAGNAGPGGSGAAGKNGAGGASAAPLFSDDFEASAIDSKWIPRINGSGTFALDKAQKHGGGQSLHVTPKSGYSTLLAIEGSPVFPAPNNTFFGRVWLRVPTLPAAGSGGPHWIWMEAGDVTNDTHEVRIGMNLGYLQTNLYFNGEVDLRDPDAPLMAATWECIEFKMGKDELIVWLNGTEATGVSTTNWAKVGNGANGGGNAMTNWSPTYAAFRLGWELNAGSDIWFDDVALGYSRIGCQ